MDDLRFYLGIYCKNISKVQADFLALFFYQISFNCFIILSLPLISWFPCECTGGILNLFEVEPPFSVTLIQIKARGTLSKFPEDL